MSNQHPTRKTLRLPDHDYSQPGAYFITLCTRNKNCLFGTIIDGHVQLNECGRLVDDCWQALPKHFPLMQLDAYVIMPNHVHAIMIISHEKVDCRRDEAFAPETGKSFIASTANASPLQDHRARGTTRGSIGAAVQNFKAVTARRLKQIEPSLGDNVWQRNYHEHVIRNEASLTEIRNYILSNPWNWPHDEYRHDH